MRGIMSGLTFKAILQFFKDIFTMQNIFIILD